LFVVFATNARGGAEPGGLATKVVERWFPRNDGDVFDNVSGSNAVVVVYNFGKFDVDISCQPLYAVLGGVAHVRKSPGSQTAPSAQPSPGGKAPDFDFVVVFVRDKFRFSAGQHALWQKVVEFVFQAGFVHIIPLVVRGTVFDNVGPVVALVHGNFITGDICQEGSVGMCRQERVVHVLFVPLGSPRPFQMPSHAGVFLS
jgi:hypothetical protein